MAESFLTLLTVLLQKNLAQDLAAQWRDSVAAFMQQVSKHGVQPAGNP